MRIFKNRKDMSDTLVIIVTYNASRWLERCLGSVADSSRPADAIIVDNGSTDGTPELVEKNWPQFKLVRTGSNLGFGAANNIGFRHALEHGYEYIYLLNQDAWLEKDTLEIMIPELKPPFGILSPLQKDAGGRLDRKFNDRCGRLLKNASGTVEVPVVMAAHWLMTAATVRLIGGFSPVFKQYGEDDNYIDRLHLRGLRCGVVTSASAVHDRADRKLSREAKMRQKTIPSLSRLSDPGRRFCIAFFCEAVWLLGMGVKNFSIRPWQYIFTLYARRNELKSCTEESRKDGAFL